MKILLFKNAENKVHSQCINAFYKGLTNNGADCEIVNIKQGYRKCDVAVLFGGSKLKTTDGVIRGRIIHQHDNLDKTVIIERGFVRRDEYYSVGTNDFNNFANFHNSDAFLNRERFDDLGVGLNSSNWRDKDKILICGQIPWDASVQHMIYHNWLKNTMNTLEAMYPKYEIHFKPHPLQPKAVKVPRRTKVVQGEIEDIIPEYRAVVAYNSNSLVDSVIAGVPAIYANRRAMVRGVGFSLKHVMKYQDIDEFSPLTLPSRRVWANKLAYTQWNLEEMEQGKPQRQLRLIGWH